MIKVQGLTKRYGDKTALLDVSFQIGPGEIVGLLGLNGAGKSTTMNILTGYLGFDKGSVVINGQDIQKKPLKAKAQIGYLPEQPAFYAGMQVREYLDFICDLKRIKPDKKARKDHLLRICKEVGLLEMQHRLIRNLSKGYRQRVSFAQALIGDPKVIILDEPTVGLDPSQVQEIRALIKRFGRDRTVLISSHILSEIKEMCSRVLVLRNGRLICDDTPENLAARTRQTQAVRLRVKGEEEAVLTALRNARGAQSARYLGVSEEGTVDVLFTVLQEQDARLIAFLALSKPGLPILHIDGAEATLEDIFLRLVGQEEGV
ncbi:MAG: ABC transporter ATP-binding protein [Clostridiales bacterium]|nr:ABC transporter ATP-binding protein [Clostridiales bacterium]